MLLSKWKQVLKITFSALLLYSFYYFSPRFIPKIDLWERQVYLLIPLSIIGFLFFKSKFKLFNLKLYFFSTLIAIALSLSFSFIYPHYLDLLDPSRDIQLKIKFSSISFSIFSLALIPAISEELFFRSFLQNSLSHQINFKFSIILTSFLFALSHLSPILFPFYLILGLFFGLFFHKGGLLVGINCHLFYNLTTILLLS